MENAILVDWLGIKKVEVDFSNIDNIYSTIGCRRVYTIHTQKTMDMSNLLGVHIMGYVDKEGNDINNQKACELTGYDYLGSKLLLFKTDGKWSELPFTPTELDVVYTYITTGVIKPLTNLDHPFFLKYPITPILPNLGFSPKIVADPDYENVVYLIYNLMFKDMHEMAMKLFNFSDRLVNEFKQVGEYNLSPTGDYYLKCLTETNYMFICVAIQAISSQDEKPIDIKPEKLNKMGQEGLF